MRNITHLLSGSRMDWSKGYVEWAIESTDPQSKLPTFSFVRGAKSSSVTASAYAYERAELNVYR